MTSTGMNMFNILKSKFFSINPRTNSTVVCQSPDRNHYRVLIAGGGTGGIAVASRLSSCLGPNELGIVESQNKHYYQAGWTLVGAGICSLAKTCVPMEKVIPKNTDWIKDKLVKFDPPNNKVVMASGKEITYDYLVISLGLTLRYDQIKGALEALKNDSRVCSNYSSQYVGKTIKAFESFKTGTAIFTLPNTPIKCAGAPQKIMFLFEDYLARKNRQKDAKIMYFTALKTLFSAPKYAESLTGICKERGIETNLQKNLIEINYQTSEAVFEDLSSKQQTIVKYDFLHVVPPMACPSVLLQTKDLTDSKFVSVDKETLRHTKFQNVFALGDCSNIPTSKTAAAIASQCKIVTENLKDVMKGGNGRKEKYNGYTSCPLITGYNKGILAEFDYNLEPLETLPIDQGKERYIFAFMKKFLLPELYWKGLLKGIWEGPDRTRKILHFGYSK